MSFTERVRYLSGIKDGWHDGDGFAPSKEVIGEVLSWSFRSDVIPIVPAFGYVYPLTEGGLIIESDIKDLCCSVIIRNDGSFEAYMFSMTSDLNITLTGKWGDDRSVYREIVDFFFKEFPYDKELLLLKNR